MPTPYGSRYSGGGGGGGSGGGSSLAVIRNTSSLPATAATNEATILTGSTTGQTLTLVNTPPTNTVNSVTNDSSVSVTVASGASDTIDHYKTASLSSILIPAGMSMVMIYSLSTNSWYVTSGGFTPGYILGSIAFRHSTDNSTYTFTATSMTAIDTTNLRLPAVIGPNGLAKFKASSFSNVNGTATNCFIGLMNGATIVSRGLFISGVNPSSRYPYEDDITGLTPGAANYDLAAYTANATFGLVLYSGPTFGPIEFSLTAA